MTTQVTDILALLKNMYAAEAEYLAADGHGEASVELLASFFASDVVLHQAEALPYGGTCTKPTLPQVVRLAGHSRAPSSVHAITSSAVSSRAARASGRPSAGQPRAAPATTSRMVRAAPCGASACTRATGP